MALVALVIAVSAIGVIGVQSVVGLTGIALASNLGTFILYGLTCVWTIIAFKGRSELQHRCSTASSLPSASCSMP